MTTAVQQHGVWEQFRVRVRVRVRLCKWCNGIVLCRELCQFCEHTSK